MRGDRFEHDDSELWTLRRKQRKFLRDLPADTRKRWADFADGLPSLDKLDVARVELMLRTTAQRLLNDLDTSAIEEASDARVRFTVHPRLEDRYGQWTRLIAEALGPIKENSELDEPEGQALKPSETLVKAGLLCAWADRIARNDEYEARRRAHAAE